MMLRALLLLVLLVAGGAGGARPLTVMSFNVRLPMASDGANHWPERRALAIRTIAEADPDVIGTQELFREQGRDIVEALPAYAWFGTGRRGGRDDEHMGVFYRRDRLRPVRFGDFWLSDTPEAPGSISWGHPFPRMVSWAVFERIADGRRFALFDTHLPYRAEDGDARARGAALLLARIGEIAPDLPVVVTGDFNDVPGSAAYRALVPALADAWHSAARRAGLAATFHGFTPRAERRIDWILTRGFRVDAVRTIDTRDGPRWPSDHYPVVAILRFGD